jgi:hypothetical protein
MSLLDLLVLAVVLAVATFWHSFTWPVALVCVIALIIERVLRGERL